MPASHTLLIGGVRSGKSRRATELATKTGGSVDVIATAEPLDEEMRIRIEAHRQTRPVQWRTHEETHALAAVLQRLDDERGGPIIVDCLSLWLTNLLQDTDSSHADREIQALYSRTPLMRRPLIFVTNETGLGVVPAAALARRFTDVSGQLHQRLAQLCDRVEMLVAGLPLVLKANDGRR